MIAILRAWKPSLFAGLMGALASQFWFLAFAIATAASVRTLALIEVLFAQIVARVMFGQRTTAREAIGMALVVAGVGLLIFAERQKLVLIVRQNRQGVKLDPLLVQRLGLVGRRFAVDRAVLGLAVMDFARLFGKFWADVVGVLGDVVAQFLEFLPQLALLRRHDGDGRLGDCRRCRGRVAASASAPGWAAAAPGHRRAPAAAP